MSVPIGLDVRPQDWELLCALLQTHLPQGASVWAFGSRVKGTARPNSDLDLVVFALPDGARAVAHLREALEESNLPFRVDLHVWADLPESFRTEIEGDHLVILGSGSAG